MRHTLATSIITVSAALLGSIPTTAEGQCNGDDPLACFNNGVCKDGSKNYAELGINSNKSSFLSDLLETTKRGMYCECPNEPAFHGHSGNTGIHCNIPYEMCDDGEQMCFNGGTCEEQKFSKGKYLCRCPIDQDKGDVWAGNHCEVKATDFCNDDEYHDITGGNWFCTNGGQCQNDIENLATKCDCPEGKYGLHCEFSEDKPCSLKCENDGVCKVGLKDFSLMAEYGLDIDKMLGGEEIYGEHCVCKDGFAGARCEAEEVVRCGDGVCFNDAECVQTVSVDGNTIYDEFCKCKKDGTGSYAGKFCEYESTTFCPAPMGHNPKDYFCANFGECPLDAHLPCDCPVGFEGPKCEIPSSAQIVETCDLKCQNGGECFFGQTPVVDKELKKLQNQGLDFLLDNKHCRCPDGFIGLRCEMKYEHCAADEHFCMQGSGCINNKDQFTCDCREAAHLLSPAYSGTFCEHAAKESCVAPGEGDDFICSNNGNCVGEIGTGSDHVGCRCDDGWEGMFCQFESLHTNGVATKAFVGFVGTMLVIVLAFAIIIIVYRRRNERATYEQTGMQEDNVAHRLAIHGYVGEDDDISDFSDETDFEFKDIAIS